MQIGFQTKTLQDLRSAWVSYVLSPIGLKEVKVLVAQSCPTLCDPMDYTSVWDFPGKYLRGLPFPSPGDPPDPGIESRFLHCRQILYCLGHMGYRVDGFH